MKMLKGITILNYRGISSLNLKGFNRINLLVGKNNSKKTTILESIFLNAAYSSPDAFIRMSNTRNLKVTANNLKSLFHNLNLNNNIEITGNYYNVKRRF